MRIIHNFGTSLSTSETISCANKPFAALPDWLIALGRPSLGISVRPCKQNTLENGAKPMQPPVRNAFPQSCRSLRGVAPFKQPGTAWYSHKNDGTTSILANLSPGAFPLLQTCGAGKTP